MERVFSKLESRGLMTTDNNTALDIDNSISDVENATPEISQDIFSKIQELLVDDSRIQDETLSIRGQLLINCTIATLDPNNEIYWCDVNNENEKLDKSTITKDELNSWIESIYNSGLYELYDSLDFDDFKKEEKSNEFRNHYRALKDIALSVQFMIGNFHNGSSKLSQIPFCKFGKATSGGGEEIPTPLVPFNIFVDDKEIEKIGDLKVSPYFDYDNEMVWKVRDEGTFYSGSDIYLRLSFINNLTDTKKFPIKTRVLSAKNGFTEETVKNINEGVKHKSFTVHQIMDIAETIINFSEVSKKVNKLETELLSESFSFVSKQINKAKTSGKNKNTTVFDNKAQKLFDKVLVDYITKSLAIKDYKGIAKVLEKSSTYLADDKDNTKTDKGLSEYLDKRFIVWCYQKHIKGGLYDSIKKALNQ